jgi:hypothetical protein
MPEPASTRLGHKEKPTSLFLAALLLQGAFLACPTQRDLFRRMDKLAGPHARNCGYVPLHTDPTAALSCARQAITARQPFKLALAEQGIDSAMTSGFVLTPSGRLIQLLHDSDRAGGSTFLRHPAIWTRSCVRLDTVESKKHTRPTLICVRPAA